MSEIPPTPSGAITATANFGNKLIETIKNFFEPTLTKKVGIAKSEVAKLETADEVERILAVGTANVQVVELAARMKMRLAREWFNQQQNIEATVAKALEYQPDIVSDDPVDPDWVRRFFQGCEDISDPVMRILWAKVLAGEVSQPGSFSRLAISILRDMGKVESNLFEKASSLFWWWSPDKAFVLTGMPGSLGNLEVMELESLGLLGGQGALVMQFKKGMDLRYGTNHYTVQQDNPDPPGIYTSFVTPAGVELSRLSTFIENVSYRDELLKKIELKQGDVKPGRS
jgi:hypothetical protein